MSFLKMISVIKHMKQIEVVDAIICDGDKIFAGPGGKCCGGCGKAGGGCGFAAECGAGAEELAKIKVLWYIRHIKDKKF